jgi:hypothetical protein
VASKGLAGQPQHLGTTGEQMKTTGERVSAVNGTVHRKRKTSLVPKVVAKVRLEEQESEQHLPLGNKVPYGETWPVRNGTGGTRSGGATLISVGD